MTGQLMQVMRPVCDYHTLSICGTAFPTVMQCLCKRRSGERLPLVGYALLVGE